MPQPDIDRRCYHCGASYRERAAFCPQCGRALAGQPGTSPPAEIHDTEDVIARDITLTEADFQRKPKPAEKPAAPAKPVASEKPAVETPASEAKTLAAPTLSEPSAPKGRAREMSAKVHKATQRARDVQDNALHRVQKVREISTVMIEEASYDPSLRFILVAGVLFVLFLLIMLLNKLIG